MIKQVSVSSPAGKWILTSAILASGLAFFSGSAVSVAIPTIQDYYQTNLMGIQWIVNSFVLALSVFLLISGALGDMFGRKRIFMYGISLFTFGSLLSGFASSVGLLVLFQVLSGIGAAMMIPGSLAIINICFKESERGRAIGLWAGLSGGIAALGPLLGGWLIQTFNWQAIFFAKIPIGIAAYLVTKKFVPESKNPHAKKIDWTGTLLIGISLLSLSYALIQAPVSGWNDGFIITTLLVSLVMFWLFYVFERKAKEPIVPLKIFKNPLVSGANLVTLLLYFALNGIIFFYILNVQQVQGYSPLIAGLSLLPPIIIITFLSGPAGSLADRIGARKPMIIGPLLVAFGMALLMLPGTQTNYYVDYLPGLTLFGFGMSLVIAPLTKSALSVDSKYSGVASGVNNAVSRIAALLAVAVLGSVMISLFTVSLESSIGDSALSSEQQSIILEQSDKMGGITIPETFDTQVAGIALNAISDSFIAAFRWAMGINVLLALLSSLIAFVMIKS